VRSGVPCQPLSELRGMTLGEPHAGYRSAAGCKAI
jgi:hypothetical protein